ncbi:hypothetical protein BH11MYX2_BH11MYX2_37750 [soil metagenome]
MVEGRVEIDATLAQEKPVRDQAPHDLGADGDLV